MWGEAGSPLPASDFTANPVATLSELKQTKAGKGGYMPSATGPSMPIPDANATSQATSKFVDAINEMTARSAAGTAGVAVGGPAGALLGSPEAGALVGGMTSQAVAPQVKMMMDSLLPQQRASAIANMTARVMCDVARRLGLTAISPGCT